MFRGTLSCMMGNENRKRNAVTVNVDDTKGWKILFSEIYFEIASKGI